MTKNVLVTSPLTSIAGVVGSHRAAQGVMYADQISQTGENVTINFGGKITDYSPYDKVYCYHGNDWGGSANLFGGMSGDQYAENMKMLADYKGEVVSLMIPFPDYADQLESRMKKDLSLNREVSKVWHDVNFEALREMMNCQVLQFPNVTSKLVIGDSHAISMYRPGWTVNSVPFKTLHGAIAMGFHEFIDPVYSDKSEITHLEVYFGNIDIRHHLLRQQNPEESVIVIAGKYVKSLEKLRNVYPELSEITIHEPLPIENESRKLPASGHFKGTPFYGSWSERNQIREKFISAIEKFCSINKIVKLNRWTSYLTNDSGELDFKHMEPKQSVHLSRASYPYWQGEVFVRSKKEKETTVEIKQPEITNKISVLNFLR